MDKIEKFKEFLGPIAKEYSDGQLRQLQRDVQANPIPMFTEALFQT